MYIKVISKKNVKCYRCVGIFMTAANKFGRQFLFYNSLDFQNVNAFVKFVAELWSATRDFKISIWVPNICIIASVKIIWIRHSEVDFPLRGWNPPPYGSPREPKGRIPMKENCQGFHLCPARMLLRTVYIPQEPPWHSDHFWGVAT